MHDYLRAIGFRKIKKNKEVRALVNLVMSHPTSEYVSVLDQTDSAFGEKVKEFSERAGISVRGEYEDENTFDMSYYFPYYRGRYCTLTEEISIEKQTDKDAFLCVCDNIHVGVSIAFNLLNMNDYLDYLEYHKSSLIYAPVYLSGLSIAGKIVLPVLTAKKEDPKVKEEKSNREHMMAAAKAGDKDAIESLTIEDMDLYATLNRRAKKEDVLTIVESYFMPYGLFCDLYSVMGEIENIEIARNTWTDEESYLLKVNINGLILDICINKSDLVGVPEIGRRFRGVVWLQGIIDFMNT